METVQPIRSKEKIEEIKSILLKGSSRNYLLFAMGINVGLRISDLLGLKIKDIANSHIIIREEKTGKEKRFKINENLRKIMNKYITNKDPEDYIFKSSKSNMPITRIQAYRIINEASRKAGITDKIGTHSCRKSFGYHHYNQFRNVALLQSILGHSSPAITLRYIGITNDMMDESIDKFIL